jgi:membrane-associated phospholipid phosphatase
MLFPVAGPFYFLGSQFTVPLKGGLWTGIGEWLRHNAQFIGGTIPSPHCANATVMWMMAFRCRRKWFWLLSPIILSLYVATVYGRFHYATDVVTGVAAGVLAVIASRSIIRAA